MINPFSKINTRIWRHKYLWTIIIFSIHIGFIDSNSLWNRYKLIQENKSTMAEISYYEKNFEIDQERLHLLTSDPNALIRVARENHRMKADDEDVYYVINCTDTDSLK